jgi:phage portal protein BeeE
MGLADRIRSAFEALRADPRISLDQWAEYFTFGNNLYGVPTFSQTLQGKSEEIDTSFAGLVTQAYKSNAIVFACMLTRLMLFSEARFMFRKLQSGRPGELIGGTDGRNPAYRDLALLAHPWPNGTTGDLLARAIQHADLGGNAFAVRRPGPRIKLLRPDWVTLILGMEGKPDVQAGDVDAELIGLLYHPGGRNAGRDPVTYLRQEFAHFAPIPDPLGAYRGMSWLTPTIRELQADTAATTHVLKFFENGATPNLVVKIGKNSALNTPEKFKAWVQTFRQEHESAANAYKTLFLDDMTEVTSVGANLEQAQFRETQSGMETRIAAASGVHPLIAGLSEGLEGSGLNTGNFAAARRLVADRTLRPLWRNFASSMEAIIHVPSGTELWYDDRDISFLREDSKDAAEIQEVEAGTIASLVTAGFKPDDVIDAITAGDLKRLQGKHTGLYSVQLQPPGTKKPEPTNGKPAASLGDLMAEALPAAKE